jgi:hypothetical protein
MNRLSYVIIIERGLEQTAIGAYRSFKKAENDAKAWNGINDCSAYVIPLSLSNPL